ncbi:MAG: ParB/RepB/Spo0J family partition protein [Candidatus Omnitrophota bacterium]
MEKRKALGRGLQALIPEADTRQEEAILYLNTAEILPNRYQPRTDFNQEKLNELMTSIKEKGVVQPLLIRRTSAGYELIAGERRLRALKALGIERAPAILKDVDDVGAIELALIENIQREGLNAVEEAHAYKQLIDEFRFTHERLAQTIGKDRTTITNTLRLLNLPTQIQRYIAEGKITAGHARAILAVGGLQQQLNLCEKIIKGDLSVREAESLTGQKLKRRPAQGTTRDPHTIEQEEMLQNALATKVRILQGPKRGRIIIEYYSTDDLERIIGKIKKA